MKAKKLRRNGYVPGSVFGGMLKEPVALQIEESVARQLVRELREGSRLKLNLDGTVIPVQIKEKSLDNLKHEILEISFQALAADQAVNSAVSYTHLDVYKRQTMRRATGSCSTCCRMWALSIPFPSFPQEWGQRATPCLCRKRTRCSTPRGKCFSISWYPDVYKRQIYDLENDFKPEEAEKIELS